MNGLTKFEVLPNGNLKISLTKDGKAEMFDHFSSPPSDDYFFLEFCEGPLCNGWHNLNPEDVGALTSSLIFSYDVEHDDNGEVKYVGAHYWFPNYQIRSPAQDLAEYGFVIFAKG